MINKETFIKNKLDQKYMQVYKVWSHNQNLYINIEDAYYLTQDLINHAISYNEIVNFEEVVNESITTIVIPAKAVTRFKKFIL